MRGPGPGEKHSTVLGLVLGTEWAGRAPRLPGLYVLFVEVREGFVASTRGRRFWLERGLYLYVGSARGPGGLRARLGRHAVRDKRVWWHLDAGTPAKNASVLGGAVLAWRSSGPERRGLEAIVSKCLVSRGAKPVPGFGASDDRECGSHFFYSPWGLCGSLWAATGCLLGLRDR